MLLVLATAMLATQTAPPAVLPREYRVDLGESIIEFSIKYAFSRIKGRFIEGNGTVLYDEAHLENSSVTIVFVASSLDTGQPLRDRHLRTSDFFDVEKYPTIVFQSDRLTRDGDHWAMQGKLTMHGVTRDITMPLRFPRAPERDAIQQWMILHAESSLRLARADFGIAGGGQFNAGFTKARLALIADSVDISIELTGYSPDAESHRSGRVQQLLDSSRTLGVQWLVDRFADIKRNRPAAVFAANLSAGELIARGMLTTGRVADAVTLSRKVTEFFPDEPRAYAIYGLALAASGDERGAARQYARMKEVFRPPVVDPNDKLRFEDANWWYLDQLVRTAIEMPWRRAAVPLAQALADMYTGNARTQATLGVALAAAGDAAGASAAYAKALTVDPRETSAIEWRRRL